MLEHVTCIQSGVYTIHRGSPQAKVSFLGAKANEAHHGFAYRARRPK